MEDISNELVSQFTQKPKRDYADLLGKIMNFENLIYEIEQILKNKVFDHDSNKWVKKGKPLINDAGISIIRGIVTSHLNNVFILSNFDDDDIRLICLNLGEDIVDELTQSYTDWDIDRRNLSIITTIVMDNIYAMLKGSFKEGIRLLLKEVEKREVKTILEKDRKSIIPFMGG